EGLRGGAGRGPGQAGPDRGDIDHRVAGFLQDAGAGRDARTGYRRVRGTAGLRADVVQFPPGRGGGGVAVVRDQPEQAASLRVHDRVGRVETRWSPGPRTVAAGPPQVVTAAAVVGDLRAAGQPLAEQPGRTDHARKLARHRPGRPHQGYVLADLPVLVSVAGDHDRFWPALPGRVIEVVQVGAPDT